MTRIILPLALLFIGSLGQVHGQSCSSCNTARLKIRGAPGFSMPSGIERVPGETDVYKAETWRSYIGSLSHSSASCNADEVMISAMCGKAIYFRIKEKDGFPKYWQYGSGLGLVSKTKPKKSSGGGQGGGGEGGEPGQVCSCSDCVGGAECRCSCYSQGGETPAPKYYTDYLMWPETQVDFNMDEEGYQMFLVKYEELNSAGLYPMIFAVGTYRIVYIDKSQTYTVSGMDSRTDELPETPYCAGWDPESEQEDEPIRVPDQLCQCRPGSGGGSNQQAPPTRISPPACEPGEDVVFEMVICPTPAGTCKMSCTSSGGPSSTEGGNQGVPLTISFNLGKNGAGMDVASLKFSAELDESNPFAAANLKLSQPFHQPADAPFTLGAPSTEQGSHDKLWSDWLLMKEERLTSDVHGMDGVRYEFYDKTQGEEPVLVSTHLLKRVEASGGNDPGIIHIEEADGQVRTHEYYGQAESGGRTWREVAPDGGIVEGVDLDFAGDPPVRVESRVNKRKTGDVEVLVNDRTDRYRRYTWPGGDQEELLIETTEKSASGEERTTSYDYYTELIAGQHGRLKSRTNPDGSWEKMEYDLQTGEVTRTLRPWLDGPDSPADATLANSVVTTHQNTDASNSWTIETVKGIVTSRKWTAKDIRRGSPFGGNASWGLGMPKWRAGKFASALADVIVNGNNLHTTTEARFRFVLINSDGSLKSTPESSQLHTNLSLSGGFSALLGHPVSYDSAKEEFNMEIGAISGPMPFDKGAKVVLQRSYVTSPGNPGWNRIYCSSFSYASSDYPAGPPTINDYSPPDGDGASRALNLMNWINSSGSYPWAYAEIDPEVPTGQVVVVRSLFIGTDYTFWTYPDPNPVFNVEYSPHVPVEYSPWQTVGETTWETISDEPSSSSSPGGIEVDFGEGSDKKMFSTTRSQTFTADYKKAVGTMTIGAPLRQNATANDTVFSMDSSGMARQTDNVAGVFNPGAKTFDWSIPGGALKTVTRVYAVDPQTLKILGQSPLWEVTMTDHYGLVRLEETWHGNERIRHVIHDYDLATNERVSTLENGVEIFSAVRSTEDNTYTQTSSDGQVSRTTYTEDGRVLDVAKVGHDAHPDLLIRQ